MSKHKEKAILAADVNGLRKEQKSVKLMFCSGSSKIAIY
jgi:hypothetical protein